MRDVTQQNFTTGFTLIELMITIVIVGILAAIAIPSFQNYSRKAYFAEVIAPVAPYRAAVGKCVQSHGTVVGCNAGSNGIPAAIVAPAGAVASLGVVDGVITVAPVKAHGVVATDTYILTPAFVKASGNVDWVVSGGGVVKGYNQ